MIADIIGYAAGAIGIASWIPQAIKSYKTRSVNDLSILMIALILIGTILWVIYGFLVHDMPIISVNTVLVMVISYLLYLKMKYEK